MKTKLDENGITVFTIENKEDCIVALNNLKKDALENKYLHDYISEIDNTVKAIEEDSFDTVLSIKNKTKYKSLYKILYIFEKDYLYKIWAE